MLLFSVIQWFNFCYVVKLTLSIPLFDEEYLGKPLAILYPGYSFFTPTITSSRNSSSNPTTHFHSPFPMPVISLLLLDYNIMQGQMKVSIWNNNDTTIITRFAIIGSECSIFVP